MTGVARAGGVVALMVAAGLIRWSVAIAQQVSSNPVTSAPDAFGMTVGLESVGIYSPGSVGDFSPQACTPYASMAFQRCSLWSSSTLDSANSTSRP